MNVRAPTWRVLAVVDVHRWFDQCVFAKTAQCGPKCLDCRRITAHESLAVFVEERDHPLRDSCTFGVVGDVEVTGEHSFAVGPFVTLEVVGHRTIVERMSWRARCRPLSGTTASCLYGRPPEGVTPSKSDINSGTCSVVQQVLEPRPCARPGWTRPMPST